MRIDRLQALNPDFSMNGIGTDNNNNPTPLGQQQGVRQTVQDNTVQPASKSCTSSATDNYRTDNNGYSAYCKSNSLFG
ncbi:MAG: hypothetical protein IJ759_04880 [Bacteroidales bacterium]|nr:hypothetical protein [Bacteroidales bacterium]